MNILLHKCARTTPATWADISCDAHAAELRQRNVV